MLYHLFSLVSNFGQIFRQYFSGSSDGFDGTIAVILTFPFLIPQDSKKKSDFIFVALDATLASIHSSSYVSRTL